MSDEPVTLGEIYASIINQIGGPSATDSTLHELLLALGAAIVANQGGGGSSFPDFTGSGSPEGVQTANFGQWYEDTSATTNGLYVFTGTNSTDTGWVQVGGIADVSVAFPPGVAFNANGDLFLVSQTGKQIFLADPTGAFNTALNTADGSARFSGVVFPVQAPTSSAPAYVEGGMYYDVTLHKLMIGGATGWEEVTSA